MKGLARAGTVEALGPVTATRTACSDHAAMATHPLREDRVCSPLLPAGIRLAAHTFRLARTLMNGTLAGITAVV